MRTNKKAWLSAIATLILVAVIGLTFAFKPAKADSKMENTYWFLMNADGTTVSTNIVSDPSTLCPALDQPNCARKYNESQTQVISGVRQVKSSQVNSQIDFRSKD